MFFASLIKDTFRVRLDAAGASINNLIAAVRASDKKTQIKPWKIQILPQI